MATQFSGGSIINTTFNGNYKCLIMQGIMNALISAGWSLQPMSQGGSSGTYGQTFGPGNISTVTLTLASPGVVNWANHGFLGGERVMFQNDVNSGATLPTGLAVNTYYWVHYVNANSFNVSPTSYATAVANFTGSTTGTIYCYSSYILLQSATQSNVTNPIVIRLNDFGGSGILTTVQNYAGTLIGNLSRYYGGCLQPCTFGNFQIVATRYQFFCFTQGNQQNNRSYTHAGMLYIPSFLTGVTDEGFVFGDTIDSETNGIYNCWRNTLSFGQNSTSNCSHIWNQNLCEIGNNNTGAYNAGMLTPLVLAPPYWPQNDSHFRWANDWFNTSDILLSCGLNTINQEGKIRGQFFDVVYIPEAFAIDSTTTFNGHTWQNLTNNQTGLPRGGVWVTIT